MYFKYYLFTPLRQLKLEQKVALIKSLPGPFQLPCGMAQGIVLQHAQFARFASGQWLGGEAINALLQCWRINSPQSIVILNTHFGSHFLNKPDFAQCMSRVYKVPEMKVRYIGPLGTLSLNYINIFVRYFS
jgi:hypothetical protein